VSRQAEKEYLQRSGTASWERLKPFAPPGEISVEEGIRLIQDFGVCAALLDLQPHHRVLDLAAGSCWAADWLQRLGLSVVAVDLSHDLLAVGCERLAETGPRRAVCGDAQALPFETGIFDRVLCLNAMHHVPNVDEALREVFRVLVHDGRAVFSEPGLGHAQQAHARRAVQDFGVQEADIDPTAFVAQCTSVGFVDVVLEPFAHIVPGHGLTAEQWQHWQTLASASRPRRAAQTFRRAFLELIGARKNNEMFQAAFASEALRVLRTAMRDHPIVIASKVPIDRFLHRHDARTTPLNALISGSTNRTAFAGAEATIAVDVKNVGTRTWIANESARGRVRVGVQLLDADRRLINRDFARTPLPCDVPPGRSARVVVAFIAPAAPNSYFIKIDLVSEGVSWFEPQGSKALVQPLVVT